VPEINAPILIMSAIGDLLTRVYVQRNEIYFKLLQLKRHVPPVAAH
jgi:hypothetical protein